MTRRLIWGITLSFALSSPDLEGQTICSLDWALEEALRIGSVDGPDALSRLTNITIGSEGEVYVPQPAYGSVSVFSRRGELIRVLGREGSGPGDFEAGPRVVSWVDGELWVADRLRAQSFGSDGRPSEFVSFQTWVGNEGSTFRPEAPLADGTFWARRSVSPPRDGAGQPTSLAIRRWTRQGDVIDTVVVLDVTDRRVVLNPQTGGFTAHPIWALLPGSLGPLREMLTADRSALVVVGDVRPGAGSFDLLRITIAGDTVLQRSISYTPVRIDRAEERWWFDQFGAVIAGDYTIGQPRVRQISEATRNRLRESARDAFWLPAYYPPVRQTLTGQDGTIWLLREPDVLEPEDRWEVYDSEGTLIGRITDSGGRDRFPPWLPRLHVLRASRDEVWATTTDDFDVPYIYQFRVDRGCR